METKRVNINAYLVTYLKEHKVTFFVFCLLLFVYPLQRIVIPKYYGKVISSLNKGENASFIENVKYMVYLYIVIQMCSAILHKVQGMLVPDFMDFSIQRIFSNLLQNHKLNYENLEVGEILAKIIKVPYIIYRYLELLRHVVFSQIFILIAAIMHYYTISNVVLYTFIALVIGIMILQYITYKCTMNIEMIREKEKDSIYQHFQDLLNNLISVVVCKNERFEKDYLHEKFVPFVDVFHKSLNLNFIFRIMFSIFNVVSFMLLNYLLYKDYKQKNITKEQFLSSFIITYSVLQLFYDANYSVRTVVEMCSQVKDMENYFNDKTDLNESLNAVKEDKLFTKGEIVFKNITYQYEENAEFQGKYAYALKDVNITIQENENVAIVGQIGSGKSTLVKMLLKFFEPTQGDIFINGTNLKEIPRSELYDHVFYIPQKPKLLNRTLYENIFYGFDTKQEDKSQNEEKVFNILKRMKIESNIIDIFREKMDQPLGNDGVKLSGGQRQMVWIIRAMLRNPSIIIFDEPTSALDKKNKENIVNMIKEIGKNKTILIISHDDIDSSFRKITMKQGEVAEESNQLLWGLF